MIPEGRIATNPLKQYKDADRNGEKSFDLIFEISAGAQPAFRIHLTSLFAVRKGACI
jgi:hypothetical protein